MALTNAERKAAFVERHNDVGEIPPPRHFRLKERCKYDLEAFGWYYCRMVLNHRAPKDLVDGFIRPIQDAILSGGQIGVEAGRGIGKTTWVTDIAPLWATLYGHRRYPVDISATYKLGKKNLKTIKKILMRSKALRDDFPAVIHPIIHLGGIAQRAASQTYRGEPTDIEWGGEQIVFPTLRDDRGELLDAGCGAIIACVGIGGSVRGSNEAGQRPDYIIFDDPQNKKIAKSPKLVADTIEYIESDALGLAGHDRVLSAFITITPQRFGDVAYELTSGRHPEWSFKVLPFIKRRCPGWDKLVNAFCEKYFAGNAAKDFHHREAREWYRENKDKFAEVETVDPLQYDPKEEEDVVHHLLNKRASMGERSFNAELMMEVADVATQLVVTPDTVMGRLNGCPFYRLPPGTDSCLATCDINIQAKKGMSWQLIAFGKRRVAAPIAWGRYPGNGEPVAPPNCSDAARNRAVARAIRAVATIICDLQIRDQAGRRVIPRVLGFDRGYLPDVVHRTIYVLKKTVPFPFPIIATKGYGDNFVMKKDELLRAGDHVFAVRTRLGEYVGFISPYWKEKMLSGFLETPLMDGSFSLPGKTVTPAHVTYANEAAAERLVRKWYDERQKRVRWEFAVLSEDNHFGDGATQGFALASYYRLLPSMPNSVDRALTEQPRQTHQDDLFDPNRNAALAAADGYNSMKDETNALGVELPHPDAPVSGSPDDPCATPETAAEHHFKMVTPTKSSTPVNKRVNKNAGQTIPSWRLFKKGRFRRK